MSSTTTSPNTLSSQVRLHVLHPEHDCGTSSDVCCDSHPQLLSPLHDLRAANDSSIMEAASTQLGQVQTHWSTQHFIFRSGRVA